MMRELLMFVLAFWVNLCICQEELVRDIKKFNFDLKNRNSVKVDSLFDYKVWWSSRPEDTIFYFEKSNYFFIKSKNNILLAQGFLDGQCSECNFEINGEYIERYSNGNTKSIGKFICGNRIGRWIYFHNNGVPFKIINYKYISNIRSKPLLFDDEPLELEKEFVEGDYIELYENGSMKEHGSYVIYEKLVDSLNVRSLDNKNYTVIDHYKKGRFWIPFSVKVGNWYYYNQFGTLIKTEQLEPMKPNKKLRLYK